jgi:predicted transcriptional regulator
MTNVRKILDKRGLSLTTGAELLGISRRQMAYYASGDKTIPPALEHSLKTMPIPKQKAPG